MPSSTKSSSSDALKHFAEHGPGWKLGALFVEKIPDILRELGPACKGVAILVGVVLSGGAITWVVRAAGWWP